MSDIHLHLIIKFPLSMYKNNKWSVALYPLNCLNIKYQSAKKIAVELEALFSYFKNRHSRSAIRYSIESTRLRIKMPSTRIVRNHSDDFSAIAMQFEGSFQDQCTELSSWARGWSSKDHCKLRRNLQDGDQGTRL